MKLIGDRPLTILFQFEISPFCDKVRRALRYKSLDFSVEEIPPSQAASGRWRSISPTGKFPVLEHDGKRIVDSTDILRYLEEIAPTPALFPADPAQRAQAHVLEDWADESLYFYELTMRMTWPHNASRWIPELLAAEKPLTRRLLTPVLKRLLVKTARNQGIGRKSPVEVEAEVGRHLQALTDLLGADDWLVGDHLSVADLSVFAQLFCIRGAVEGERLVTEHYPVVAAWMDRVDAATRV